MEKPDNSMNPLLSYEALRKVYDNNQENIQSLKKVILVDMKTGERKVIEGKDQQPIDIFDEMTVWFRTVFAGERKIEDALPKLVRREFKHVKEEAEKLEKDIDKEESLEKLEKEIKELEQISTSANKHSQAVYFLEKNLARKQKLEQYEQTIPSQIEGITKKAKMRVDQLREYNNILNKWQEVTSKTGDEKVAAIKVFLETYQKDVGGLTKDLRASLEKKVSREDIKDALNEGIESASQSLQDSLLKFEVRIRDRESPDFREQGMAIPLVNDINKWKEDQKTLLNNHYDSLSILQKLKGKEPSEDSREFDAYNELNEIIVGQNGKLEEIIQGDVKELTEEIKKGLSELPKEIMQSGDTTKVEELKRVLYILSDRLPVLSDSKLKVETHGLGDAWFRQLLLITPEFATAQHEFFKSFEEAISSENLESLDQALEVAHSTIVTGPFGREMVQAMNEQLSRAHKLVMDKKEDFSRLLAGKEQEKTTLEGEVNQLTEQAKQEASKSKEDQKLVGFVAIPILQLKELMFDNTFSKLMKQEGVLEKLSSHIKTLQEKERKLTKESEDLEASQDKLGTEESIMQEYANGNDGRLTTLKQKYQEYQELVRELQKGRSVDANLISLEDWLSESKRMRAFRETWNKREAEWLETVKGENQAQLPKDMVELGKTMARFEKKCKEKIQKRDAIRNDLEMGNAIKELAAVSASKRKYEEDIKENSLEEDSVSSQLESCMKLQSALESAFREQELKVEISEKQEMIRSLSSDAAAKAEMNKYEERLEKLNQLEALAK